MDQKQFVQLLMLVSSFLILLFVFFILLSPIFALLYAALTALVVTVLWHTWPRFRVVITLEYRRWKESVKAKVSSATRPHVEEYDATFHTEYQLVFTQYGRNNRIPVDKETFVIGRGSECDLVIHDSSISKEHCRIVCRRYSHTYYIEDLRSNNGTYLGVRRLEPFTQEKLLENAQITIADRVYFFTKLDA